MSRCWPVQVMTVLVALAIARPAVAAMTASPVPASAPRILDQRTSELPDTRIISMSPDGRWVAGAQPAVGYQRGRLDVFVVVPEGLSSAAPVE